MLSPFFLVNPNPSKVDKPDIFALFEKELQYLGLDERKAFFVFLKKIIENFSKHKEDFYKMTTKELQITEPGIQRCISMVKKSLSNPIMTGYSFKEGSKIIKPFYSLLYKFTSKTLRNEFYHTALTDTLPFLEEQLEGISLEVVKQLRDVVTIRHMVKDAERDVIADKEILEECIGYVNEGISIPDLVANKTTDDLLREIEVLREAKMIVQDNRFDAQLIAHKKNNTPPV